MRKTPFQNAMDEFTFGEEERKSNFRFFAVFLCVLFLLLFLWNAFVSAFGVIIVDGNSMNLTLTDGQKLLMRFTTENYQAKRGDVIIVDVKKYNLKDSYGNPIDFLIKRLIAVEGDKVRCTDGQVEICYAGTSKYVPLDEPYAYYEESYDFAEYTVDAGEIFFLGDNRTDSKDSRYQEGLSQLNDLYKADDIFGVVPAWTIKQSCAN